MTKMHPKGTENLNSKWKDYNIDSYRNLKFIEL